MNEQQNKTSSFVETLLKLETGYFPESDIDKAMITFTWDDVVSFASKIQEETQKLSGS